mmetsp:Transcript_41384/g.74925  ORF Transcript_41384/g.74925 Transcript_41384/m.74925 type:complete len:737 (+) Transcript_41384:60-2270(+)
MSSKSAAVKFAAGAAILGAALLWWRKPLRAWLFPSQVPATIAGRSSQALRQTEGDSAESSSPARRASGSAPPALSEGEVEADRLYPERLPPVPPATSPTELTGASASSPSRSSTDAQPMRINTVLAALQACEKVNVESIWGPFQMSGTDNESPVVCFQFRMSHFTCKAYLAYGTQEEGSQHLKLQTVFEDNRRSLGEEHRYFIANEWNATKRYTRLKCGSGAGPRGSVFNLEYDVLLPLDLPHSAGLLLVVQTLRMWYTSMVACVMHIVADRELPFATHSMIQANTLTITIQDEDTSLQQQTCAICLEQFKVGEKARRLPCLHLFHVVNADAKASQGRHCNIDRHLVCDKHCPVCKTPIDVMEQMERTNAASSSQGGEGEGSAVLVTGTTAGADATPLGRTAQAAAAVVSSTDVVATPTGGEQDPTTLQGPVISPAAEGGEPNVLSDGPPAGDANNSGESRMDPRLPAQAAELERAVRSLQTRWLQIQDFVSGMQQMLHYIEERQSLVQEQQTLAQQPQAITAGSENIQVDAAGTEAVAHAALPNQTTRGEGAEAVNEALSQEGHPLNADIVMEDVNQLEDGEYSARPVPPLGAGGGGESSAAAPEELLTALASNVDPATSSTATLRVVVQDTAGQISGDQNPTAASGASDVSTAPPALTTESELQVPPREGLANSDVQTLRAVQQASSRSALSSSTLWRPYSESEKDCMAKVWRTRREKRQSGSPLRDETGPPPR